jgi:hypothetical protein
MPPAHKTGIVVIHQLPETLDTLWLRILGKQKVQQRAIAEIDRLDPNSPYRQNALRLLLDLRVVLETRQNRNNQDTELLMSLRTSQPYLEYMAQINREAERGLILKQLNRKLGSLSSESIDKINNLNVEKLEALGEALLDFTNVNDLNTWLE